jgi:hypothetical protein
VFDCPIRALFSHINQRLAPLLNTGVMVPLMFDGRISVFLQFDDRMLNALICLVYFANHIEEIFIHARDIQAKENDFSQKDSVLLKMIFCFATRIHARVVVLPNA